MKKISAIIICMREEGNIQQCLKSINFVDEIIIIDSGATERTLEICKKFTDRIVRHPWPSYRQQMEYARDIAKNEWVLSLDVNEAVSEKLKENIIFALEKDHGRYAGYRMKRQYFYSNQQVNHCWHPELQIRLYRKSKAQWVRRNQHYSVELDGRCRDLKGDLKYSPYQDLSQYLHAVDSRSSMRAREEFEKGKPEYPSGLVFSPLFYFVKAYGLKRGFLDGMPGLVISVLESYGRFLESAKLWEMRNAVSADFLHSVPLNRFQYYLEKIKGIMFPEKRQRHESLWKTARLQSAQEDHT
ncbi:MAG: glycosyltransferase family 2 protein [bacterium]